MARKGSDGNNRAPQIVSAERGVLVTVVYAPPGALWERPVDVPAGATLADAVAQSGVLDAFTDLCATPLSTGVFGKLRGLDDPLHEGDRVEIYRPLTVDPKEARRIRADVRKRAAAKTPRPQRR